VGTSLALPDLLATCLYSDQDRLECRLPAFGGPDKRPEGGAASLLGGPRKLNPMYYKERWASAREIPTDEPNKCKFEVAFRENESTTWNPQGCFLVEKHDFPLRIVPLSDRRVLLIASLSGRGTLSQLLQGWSPFMIFQRSGQDWVLESRLEVELTAEQKRPWSRDLTYGQYSVVGDHLVIGLPCQAALCIVDLTRRKVTHQRDIFGAPPEGVSHEDLSGKTFILGTFPLPEGSVVLVTRSRAAWNDLPKELERRRNHASFALANLQTPEGVKQMEKRTKEEQDRTYSLHPELCWWELDPATGKLDRLGVPPKGCPDFYQTPSQLQDLRRLRPHLDGTLRPLGQVDPTQKSAKASEESKPEPQVPSAPKATTQPPAKQDATPRRPTA